MAMVSIDPKALEHACLCAGRSVHHFDRMGDDLPLRSSIVAHARAIERLESTEARHAAELREQAERFSEVAARMVAMAEEDCSSLWAGVTRQILAPFILPAPDPLVEAMVRAWPQYADRMEACNNDAKALCAAIEARGGKIVWEAGE